MAFLVAPEPTSQFIASRCTLPTSGGVMLGVDERVVLFITVLIPHELLAPRGGIHYIELLQPIPHTGQ